MKIRQGFVSNSSSSSFIVAFDKLPSSAEEMRRLLFFKDQEILEVEYIGEFPVETVAQTVFDDIKKPMSDEDGIGICRRGWMARTPDSEDFEDEAHKIDYDAWGKALDEFAKQTFLDFRQKYPDAEIYSFEYHDNRDEYEAALEHGDIFRRLPHLKISNH